MMSDTPQTIEAVALALLNRVVDAERASSVPLDRGYFLKLYRECLGAVQHPIPPANVTAQPDGGGDDPKP